MNPLFKLISIEHVIIGSKTQWKTMCVCSGCTQGLHNAAIKSARQSADRALVGQAAVLSVLARGGGAGMRIMTAPAASRELPQPKAPVCPVYRGRIEDVLQLSMPHARLGATA